MTIVCAFRLGGETWLGSDTRVSCDGFIYPERCQKWLRFGDWALGLAGSSSLELHMRRASGRLSDAQTPWDIAWAMHDLAKEGDFSRQDDDLVKGEPPIYSWNMIAVSAEHFALLSGSGAVGFPARPFLAIGSGSDVAYGALHVAELMEFPADVAVRRAVEAAMAFHGDCGGDVVVERF